MRESEKAGRDFDWYELGKDFDWYEGEGESETFEAGTY